MHQVGFITRMYFSTNRKDKNGMQPMPQKASYYKTSVLKLCNDTCLSCDTLKAQSSWHKYKQCWSVGCHTCHTHGCWGQPNPDMHADMSHTNATLQYRYSTFYVWVWCVVQHSVNHHVTFCVGQQWYVSRAELQLISTSDLLECFPHILSTIILQIVTYFLQETQ
jgi:hypothetical protein